MPMPDHPRKYFDASQEEINPSGAAEKDAREEQAREDERLLAMIAGMYGSGLLDQLGFELLPSFIMDDES